MSESNTEQSEEIVSHNERSQAERITPPDGMYLITGRKGEGLYLINARGEQIVANEVLLGIPNDTLESCDFDGAVRFARVNQGTFAKPSRDERLAAHREFGREAFGALQDICRTKKRKPHGRGILEWTGLCIEHGCGWEGGVFETAAEAETKCADHKKESGHSHVVCFQTLSRWTPKACVGPGYTSINGIVLPEAFCHAGIGWREAGSGKNRGGIWRFHRDGMYEFVVPSGEVFGKGSLWKACKDNHLVLEEGDGETMLAMLYVEPDLIICLPNDEDEFWVWKKVSV